MDLSILLAFVVVVIVALLILFPTNDENARSRKMLLKIPGPRVYPILGSALPILFIKKEDRMAWIQKVVLSRKRPLTRWFILSKAFVSVCAPELIEVVLRNTNLIDKSFVYDFLHPWLGNGLLTSTGSKWHLQRKIITPTFHFSILDGFSAVFGEKANILVQRLQKEAGGPGFYIHEYISKCALDIICETAMGISCNAQEKSSDYLTAVNKMTHILTFRMSNLFLHPGFIYKLTPYYRTEEKNLKIIQAFVNKVIQERKKIWQTSSVPGNVEDTDGIGRKKRSAFLDTLLAASENGSKMTDEEIRDEVHTFMFEGHDTVTSAMCWALFELGHHRHIQDKAYEEQEQIFGGSDRAPRIADLNNMNYLERVIKETLRLHPSVLSLARTARHDFELGGHTIPAGTNIEFPVHYIHRDPEVFPDPDDFNPDNFLPEKVVNRHPYAYIPFSAGPRNCIGQRFAILEEKAVLSYLLRNYTFKTLNKREGFKVHLEMINTPVKPIKLAIEARK